MELTFDIRGNLIPYERTELFIDNFEEFFVDSFDIDSTRKEIFKNYQKYIHDFKEEVTSDFIQWINGSFATNKKNPRDIDFVTLINHADYSRNRELIDSWLEAVSATDDCGDVIITNDFDADGFSSIETKPESYNQSKWSFRTYNSIMTLGLVSPFYLKNKISRFISSVRSWFNSKKKNV